MKTDVKRRPFGTTGLMVSEVSFGAMNLRMLQSRDEALRLVHDVLDRGINLIDTARAYKGVNGSGAEVESEEMVGAAVASRTDIDEPLVIVTKGHGYTPEEFDLDLERSHRTLGVRKTEQGLFIGSTEIKLVVFYHGIKADRWEQMRKSGAIERGRQRQAAGDLTYLGFSSHYGDGKEIREALDTGAFQVIELPYNVYNRAIGEDGEPDLLRYARERGVAVINMKAFGGTSMMPMSKIIADFCPITYADMLRFCLSNPHVSTVDAGVRTRAELDADIAAAREPAMSEADRTRLMGEADRVSGHFKGICRECMHCMEKFACPQHVAFPEILGIHARYSLAKALGHDTAPYAAQYASFEGTRADACVACGGCNAWCEYHLDIPQLLARAHAEMNG